MFLFLGPNTLEPVCWCTTHYLERQTNSPHCRHILQGEAIPKRCLDTSHHLVSVNVHVNSPSSDARSPSRTTFWLLRQGSYLCIIPNGKLTFSKCHHTSPPLQSPAMYIYPVALQCEGCVKVFYVLRTCVPRKTRVSHIQGSYRQLGNVPRQTLQSIFQHTSHWGWKSFVIFVDEQ